MSGHSNPTIKLRPWDYYRIANATKIGREEWMRFYFNLPMNPCWFDYAAEIKGVQKPMQELYNIDIRDFNRSGRLLILKNCALNYHKPRHLQQHLQVLYSLPGILQGLGRLYMTLKMVVKCLVE